MAILFSKVSLNEPDRVKALTRNQGTTRNFVLAKVSVNKTYVTLRKNFVLRYRALISAFTASCPINETRMTPVQLQAALRMKAALLSQSKEKMRDLLYLRQAGSKGISV